MRSRAVLDRRLWDASLSLLVFVALASAAVPHPQHSSHTPRRDLGGDADGGVPEWDGVACSGTFYLAADVTLAAQIEVCGRLAISGRVNDGDGSKPVIDGQGGTRLFFNWDAGDVLVLSWLRLVNGLTVSARLAASPASSPSWHAPTFLLWCSPPLSAGDTGSHVVATTERTNSK